MVRTAEIKRRFLTHVQANGHTVIPLVPLPLPLPDPNLLFVNAGVVQFVPHFVGQATGPYPRAVAACRKALRCQWPEEGGAGWRL